MRSGCLNVVVVLVAASVATALTVVGTVLFLFAALSFESPTRIEAILSTVVALVAGYFFVRVGLSVWRDLRGPPPKLGSGVGKQEERGPTEDDGR